jgi:hypothetical protein
MERRIRKAEIENFLLDFSRRNQFKPMVVERASGRRRERMVEDVYFLGFYCKMEIGGADKIFLFKATMDYRFIGEVVFEVENVKDVSFTKGAEIDEIVFRFNKLRYIVKVFGRPNDNMRRETIAKVAYFIWERKGGIGSQELENWAEAERVVQDWIRIFTDGFIRI